MLIHYINKDNTHITKTLSHVVNIYRRCIRMKLIKYLLLWKLKMKQTSIVYVNVHERLFNNYKDKQKMLLQLEEKYNLYEGHKHPFIPNINHTKINYSPAMNILYHYDKQPIQHKPKTPQQQQHRKLHSELPITNTLQQHIRRNSSNNTLINYALTDQVFNNNNNINQLHGHLRNNSFNYNYSSNNIHKKTNINNDNTTFDCVKPTNYFRNTNRINNNYSSLSKPISAMNNSNKMNLTLSRSTLSVLSTRNKTHRGVNNSNIHSIIPNTPLSTRLYQCSSNLTNSIPINSNYHTIQYHRNNNHSRKLIHNNSALNQKNLNLIQHDNNNNSFSDLQIYFKASSSHQSSKRGSNPSFTRTNNKSILNNTNESLLNKTILHCTESGNNTIPIYVGVLSHDEPAKSINNNNNNNNSINNSKSNIPSMKRNPSSLTSHLNNSSLDGKTTLYNSQNKSKNDSQIMNNLDRSKSSKNIKKRNRNTNEIKYSFRTNPHSPNHTKINKNGCGKLISHKDMKKDFNYKINKEHNGVVNSSNSNSNSNKTKKSLSMQRKVVDENINPKCNDNGKISSGGNGNDINNKYEITLQSINDSKLYEIANHYITTDESLNKYQYLNYGCNSHRKNDI